MGFHKKTIDSIVRRLEATNKYVYVLKEVPYSKSEMDVVAYRDIGRRNYLLVFEVKSKDRYKYRHKAMKQLRTHEDTFGNTVNKMYKFYVLPKNKIKRDYKIERVK